MWSKPTRSDELYHWGLKSGAKSKDHKYVARTEEGVTKAGTPKYRYFYSMAEYQAYKLGQAGKKATNAVGNTVKGAANAVNDTTNAVKTDVNKKVNKVGEGIDSVKKAFSKEDNIYNVNKKNYEKRKEQIQNTDEWKSIAKDKKSEYLRKDSEGKKSLDYDQYLVDKKHPILDALGDIGRGRKVTIQKQNASTLIAGTRDYVKMGQDFVQAVAGVGIGILTFKIKKQQGSYKEQEAALKQTIKDAKKGATTAMSTKDLIINQISNEAKSRTSSELATSMIDMASTIAKGSIDKNGKLKKPDRETINNALDQVADVAMSNAKTQAERDKIELATKKAKEYSGMSKSKLKDAVIDDATSVAKSKAKNDEQRELIDRASYKTKEYSNMSKDELKNKVSEDVNSAKDKAEKEARAKVRNYIDTNPKAEAGISAYASEKGISYAEAKYELINSPLSVIKKYAEKARR